MTTHNTVVAWFVSVGTALTGIMPVESWVMVVGVACTLFTTVGAHLHRKRMERFERMKLGLVDKPDSGHEPD